MTQAEIIDRLKSSFSQPQVEVFDLTGGGDHWEVHVKSPDFAQKSRIQQHQMVMQVFREELKSGEVHALSIKTEVL